MSHSFVEQTDSTLVQDNFGVWKVLDGASMIHIHEFKVIMGVHIFSNVSVCSIRVDGNRYILVITEQINFDMIAFGNRFTDCFSIIIGNYR